MLNLNNNWELLNTFGEFFALKLERLRMIHSLNDLAFDNLLSTYNIWYTLFMIIRIIEERYAHLCNRKMRKHYFMMSHGWRAIVVDAILLIILLIILIG